MGLFGKDRYIDRPVVVREKETKTEFIEKSVNKTVEIHEHRAPTADTARLLKELEETALQKLVDRVRLSDNGFECVIHAFIDAMNDETVYIVRYQMNGRKGELEHREPGRQNDPGSKMDVFARLRDKLAVDVAAKILASAFNDIKPSY